MKVQQTIITLFLALFLGLIFNTLSAQSLTQTLRGQIIDADSKSPLSFVNVVVIGSDPLIGTTSDLDGYFKLANVPVGRISIQATYLGYEEKIIANLLLISGKETVLELEMKESIRTLEEIVVTAKQHKSENNNEMAQISAKNLSVEESNRYAGGIGDPARLVSSFAGVSSTGEGNNDILVRGNNSRFVQWRLEGTEIPSPNHFSQEGLTGGPISALNSKMLANSEFYTGAFAPQYGNALGGIFDMRLRTGNNEKHENSFSIGVLGTDFTTEGPIKKGSRASYLVNYRYSTLSLLDQLNVVDFGGVPKYQDLSFKLFLPTQNAGTFSLFGLGGKSQISTELSDELNPEMILERYDENSRLGVLGLKHLINLNNDVYVNTTLSYSNNSSQNHYARIVSSEALQEYQNSDFNNNALRINTTLYYKLTAKHQIQAGLVYSNFNFDFNNRYFDQAANEFITNQNIQASADLGQAFVSWKWRVTEKLALVNGVHSQKTSQHNELTIEPRSSLKYALSKNESLTAGFGMHSTMTSLSNYFAIVPDLDGNPTKPNQDLKLLKARHYVLGYENRLSKNLFLKIEAYYQDLYDIPVEAGNSSYSLINQTFDFTDRVLVNQGKGRNVGLELTLERFFANNYYFLFTGSLFNAEYLSGDGIWRNSKFNGNYVLNGLFGKEFILGHKRNKVLAVNSKLALIGAGRLLDINLAESIASGSAVYDEENAFKNKGEDIVNLNLAVSYRINKKKLSHEFKIDIQNITNNQSVIDYYYDDLKKEIQVVNQLSLLPVAGYTLNF